MTKTLLLAIAGTLLTHIAFAQKKDELFGTPKQTLERHSGVIIGANGNFDLPAGDLSKRFGVSYRVGPSLLYKTRSNWIIGGKFDFIFGGKVKEDSLMINIRLSNGAFIDETGIQKNVGVFERGYLVGLQAGKLMPFSDKNPESGLLIMTGIGFMQHKILIVDKDNTIIPIKGDNKKGYDRLTNGLYLEQFVGFNHFGQNGFFNYHIGFDIAAGFTKCRRDFIYDVMRPETDNRVDILFGIRGGWYIPIFKRKSDDIYY